MEADIMETQIREKKRTIHLGNCLKNQNLSENFQTS